MIELFIASAMVGLPLEDYCFEEPYRTELSDQERQIIWTQIHFHIKKMNEYLDRADAEAAKITKVDIEQATRAAINGAIAGISTRNCYGVVISSCLNTLGAIAGDSYMAFKNAKNFVRDSQYHAQQADALQERLWRDE